MTTVAASGELAPTKQDFPVLDTMRAIGALAVLTTHVAFWSGDYTGNGIWGTALSRLDVGVAIFFVLSGFLLSRPYIDRSSQRRKPPSTARYFWKRFLRIFPLYLVVALTALIVLDENANRGAYGWVKTLTLTDLYLSESLPVGLSQMWSLSTEVAFYVALPLLMFISLGRPGTGLRPTRVSLAITVMVAISMTWLLALAARIPAEWTGMPLQWLPAYMSWFAVGIGLALVHVLISSERANRAITWLATLGTSPGTCWTMALALFVVASTPLAGPSLLAPPTLAEAVAKNLLYAAIAGLLILPGIFTSSSSVYVRVFSSKALRHLGHISYGIFSVHLLVLHLVMNVTGYDLFAGHGAQIFVLTAVVSIAISEILYRFVELPFMRLKNWRLPKP